MLIWGLPVQSEYSFHSDISWNLTKSCQDERGRDGGGGKVMHVELVSILCLCHIPGQRTRRRRVQQRKSRWVAQKESRSATPPFHDAAQYRRHQHAIVWFQLPLHSLTGSQTSQERTTMAYIQCYGPCHDQYTKVDCSGASPSGFIRKIQHAKLRRMAHWSNQLWKCI